MQPIENVLTVFIYGSSNEKAAYVIGSCVYSPEFPSTSAQIIELHAVATVFKVLKNQALICIQFTIYNCLKLFLF